MRRPFILFHVLASLALSVIGQSTSASKPRSCESPDVAEIVADVRNAVGYAAWTLSGSGLKLEGTRQHSEVDSRYALLFTPDGRFLDRTGIPLGETNGFDGRAGWMVDYSGMPMRLEMSDLETEQASVWVANGRWLADEGPFALSVIPEETDSRQVTLRLRLKKGLLEARLVLDRATWLPASLRYRTTGGEESWDYSDYHPEQGLTLAHTMVHHSGGQDARYRIDSASTLPRSKWEAFKPVTKRPDDTRFSPGVSAVIVSRRTQSGHTFVHPLINGKDVGWFFLDSGADSMVITPQAAEAAGMPSIGENHATGVGGTVPTKLRRGDRFDLGPVSISNLTYIELDLGSLSSALGLQIGGVCGYELFSRAIVSLDAEDGHVEMYEPARYRPEGVRWEDLHLEGKNACIRCRFEGGRQAIFRLDTGAGDTVAFHAPAVRRYRLLEGRETKPAQSGGVGGTVEARAGKIAWFEIGGYRFESPDATFSLAQQGAFTDIYTAGNVGQQFLLPFRVIFDYPHRRIGFVRLPVNGRDLSF